MEASLTSNRQQTVPHLRDAEIPIGADPSLSFNVEVTSIRNWIHERGQREMKRQAFFVA